MTICIYKITSPSGKVYIGQTRNLESRMKDYEKLFCKSQRKLYASICKYGWNTHILEVVAKCFIHELNDLEIYYINQYNSQQKGLNVLSGGQGGVQDDVARLKMRNAKLGKKQSLETIEKRINALKGRKRTEQEIELSRQALTGRTLSSEHIAKLSKIRREKGIMPPSRLGKIPWNKGLKLK